MYSKFPLSLERLPRARRCGCLSLRVGCVLTALVCILYSVLALSQCIAEAVGLGARAGGALEWTLFGSLMAVLVTSLSVSALMLVGVLRDKPWMVRPWVVFKALQLGAAVLLLIVGSVLEAGPLGGHGLLSLALDFLAIVVRFYMLTVVASYCRQLEDEDLVTPLRAEGASADTLYTNV